MTPSRRTVAGLSAATAIAGAAGAATPGAGAPSPAHAGLARTVRSFGARGDGVSDDTAAFRAAAASMAEIEIPAGRYRLSGDVAFACPVRVGYRAVMEASGAAVLTFRGGLAAPVAAIFAFSAGARAVFDPATQTAGHPEWWGAVTGDPALDCGPAINACIVACPVTRLQAGAYYIRTEIVVGVHGRTIQGVQATQQAYAAAGLGTLSATCTQIVLARGDMNGMLVGYDVAVQPGFLLEFVRLQDFAIHRATAAVPFGVAGATPIQNPASGVLPCPTAIRFKWCVNMQVERVLVAEHAIGFYIYGCVESYWTNCSSLRGTLGARPGNDSFSGFYLDYSAPLAANGGNASIYIDRCRSFCNNQPMTYQAGLTTHQGFVDLFIDRFESGLIQFGIDLQADGDGSTTQRAEDCQIAGPVLDSASVAAIRIMRAGINADIHIDGGYLACAGATSACLLLGGAGPGEGIGGSVCVTGVQMIGSGVGVLGHDATTVNLVNNTYADMPTPVRLTNAHSSQIRDFAHRPSAGDAHPIVTLIDCHNCEVAVGANGVAGAMSCGVAVEGASSNCEINLTRIQATLVGGAANKIFYNGSPWGGGRAFGAGNIATGVLT